jgi:HK97 family phage major capsid protein
MANVTALRANLDAIETERRSISADAETRDGTTLTDEQATRWLELDESEAEIRAALAEAEAAEARAAKVAESRAKWGSAHVSISTTPASTDAEEVRYLRPAEARDRALRALDDSNAVSHLRAEQLEKVEALVRNRTKDSDGDVIARRLLLTENDAYRSGFMKAVTQTAPAYTSDEARALDEFRAASLGTSSAGGFGVPVLIDPSIILTSQMSLNPFRKIARQVTITNDQWKGVSSAGVTWSIDSEAAAVSDDAATLAQPTVATGTARGFIPYSIEIGMDYPSFAAEMSTLLSEGYDELQASHFATGAVSSTNRGIVTALDANTNVEVVVGTDGAFSGPDINKVWAALPDRFKNTATWVMSHDVAVEISAFSNSNNLGFFTTDLTGLLSTLKTRPVEFSSYTGDFTATTGASNLVIVGDFRNFVIADRAGMNIELVPHLFDVTNNRPTGQRGWFAWARFGSNSVNDLAFRLLQNQ